MDFSDLDNRHIEAVAIGASAGGVRALSVIFDRLPGQFTVPVLVVMHRHAESKALLESNLEERLNIRIQQVEDKTRIQDSTIYMAPANYHLLAEDKQTLSLSTESPVNYARPSIDVFFESAAEVYGERLVGIIMTGANSDGSIGLKKIQAFGGLTVIQDPKSAEYAEMPTFALKAIEPDLILTLEEIGDFLRTVFKSNQPKK